MACTMKNRSSFLILDNATYAAPSGTLGHSSQSTIFFRVCPWTLHIVLAYAGTIG